MVMDSIDQRIPTYLLINFEELLEAHTKKLERCAKP